MNKFRTPLSICLIIAAMELCCLYLGLSLIRDHPGLNYLAFGSIMLLYPVFLLINLMLSGVITARKFSLMTTAGVGIALVLLVAGMAARDALTSGYPPAGVGFQIIFSGLAWWLGNSLARSEFSYQYISFRFQISCLLLLILAAVTENSIPALILFFVLAMAGLLLARQAASRRTSIAVLQPFRIPAALVGILILCCLSLGVLLVFSPDASRVILQVFSAAGDILGAVQPTAPTGEPWQFSLSCSIKPDEEGGGLSNPPPVSDGTAAANPLFFWALLVLVLVLIVSLIIFFIRRFGTRREALPVRLAGVETNKIRLNIRAGLAGFFKGLLKTIRSGLTNFFKLFRFKRRQLLSEKESLESIRDIYRSFLKWASRRAAPRSAAQTPAEYLRALCPEFPGKERDLQEITGAFIKSRYSRQAATREEFESAKKAWDDLKSG